MSQSELKPEDLRAIEQTRQRLYQLNQGLDLLRKDMLGEGQRLPGAKPQIMPTPESLQSYASILSQNLKTLTSHLNTHSALLSKTIVYPHSNFPGRTQQDLVFNLVRKKVEPEVEGWEEEGRALANREGEAREDEELWGFAQDWITGRIVEAAKEGRRLNYTREEVEAGVQGVRTGLRRPPRVREREEEEESSEEEEEEEEVDLDEGEGEVGVQVGKGDGLARNADAIARFMVTGAKDGGQPQPQGPPGMAFAMRR